jgi:rod shape-determining protein MreC
MRRYSTLQICLSVAFFLLIGCSTIIILTHSGFSLYTKNGIVSVMPSIYRRAHAVISRVPDAISTVWKITPQTQGYKKLSRKLQNYEYTQQNNAEIKIENTYLREQLDLAETLEYVNYPAFIVGRNTNSWHSQLTIGRGNNDGIKKNMPVIAVQNGTVGVVGKVIAAGTHTSKVASVYDFNCNISGRIQTTRDIGLVTGSGVANSPLFMRFIKKTVFSELQYGDIVVTSGENGNYPRDIPIGSISKIAVTDNSSFLGIELLPSIDFPRLETVIAVDMKTSRTGNE